MLLTTPIWLFALAAISIPVAIHLWNIRPGKTLKVGSISLFTESSPKSSRSFQLMDILLLILRCLLLGILALILAVPLWQQDLNKGKVKGWVMIPKEHFSETYHHFQPAIDTLISKGYEFHYLNTGFFKADIKELLLHPLKDTATGEPANYWLLTQQLSQQVPGTLPVALFTPNTTDHFTGSKPLTSLQINWQTYTPADSVSTWIAGAWLKPDGQVRVLQGTSTPSGTGYHYIDLKNGGQPGSAYLVSVENGRAMVGSSSGTDKIAADTATRRMAIYTDKYAADANYLKAALDAIAQLDQRKVQIRRDDRAEAVPADLDWLFWLSDKPVTKKAKNLFLYESGKVIDNNSWLISNTSYNVTQGQTKIPLHKSITTHGNNDRALWTDGNGNTLLDLAKGDVNTYHFYTHFDQAWNDLVWNDALPKWLLELVRQEKYPVGIHERRALSNEAIQPVHITGQDKTTDTQSHYTDLSRYLWLLLVLIFITERWLATQNKLTLANG